MTGPITFYNAAGEPTVVQPVTPLPVTPGGGGFPIIGNGVTPTNRSGTIIAGGSAQVLAAPNSARKGIYVQNNSNTTLTINDVGTASATAGIVLAPGQLYDFPMTGVPITAISIFGALTGQRFDAREW